MIQNGRSAWHTESEGHYWKNSGRLKEWPRGTSWGSGEASVLYSGWNSLIQHALPGQSLRKSSSAKKDLGIHVDSRLDPVQECPCSKKGQTYVSLSNRSGAVILPLYSPLGKPCPQHDINSVTLAHLSKSSGGQRKLEHFTHERKLIELGLLSLKKKSVNSCNYLMGACRECGPRFFSGVHRDKIKGGGHKLHLKKIIIYIKNKITVKVVKLPIVLPKEAAESQSSESLKIQQGKTPHSLL